MEASPRTLWVISDELEALGEQIAESGGVLSPELEAALDAVEEDFTAKVERVALYIRDCELNAEKAKMEADRLTKIRRHHESKAKGLKSYLLAVMERHGREKVDTYKARVSRVANSRPTVSWQGDGEYADVPDEFRTTRTVHKLNTDRVLEAIRDGEPLPDGVVVERGSHIRIS